jgi:hypothetical protein
VLIRKRVTATTQINRFFVFILPPHEKNYSVKIIQERYMRNINNVKGNAKEK